MKEGWEIKKLGEVAKAMYGYTEKASFEEIGPKFLRITDIQKDGVDWVSVPFCKISEADFKKYKLVDGDIVFARTGATTGKSYLVTDPPESVFASYLIKVRIVYNRLSPEFLFLFFQTKAYWDSINAGVSGSAQGGFNATKLSQLNIPLPPLPEQQRIVAILDEAFAAIAKAKANAEQNFKNAKELFESYLQGIFEKKGECWEEKKLEDVVDSRCTLSYGIVQPGNEFPNGLPVIRPTDLTRKIIHLTGLKRIDPQLANSYKRTSLKGDELLLCVRGSTGVVSIASEELKGANVTRGIVPICFNSSILTLQFGYYLFISEFVQKQIEEKTYGAALMQINIRDVRKIQVLIPPFSEQKAIVKKLDALSAETKKLEALYQKKIYDLEELKKSILQKAFSGQLSELGLGRLEDDRIKEEGVSEVFS